MNVLMETVLWKYDVLKNGEHPIQVRITQFKDVKYISSGFSSSLENWDEEKTSPKSTHPKFKDVIAKHCKHLCPKFSVRNDKALFFETNYGK